MKKKEVQAIVESNIDALKDMLGLSHWDIDMRYGVISERKGTNGLCTTNVDWVDSAIIKLNPKKIYSEEEVLEVLQHELVHCLISSFHLSIVAAGELVTEKEYDALTVLHCRADEEVTTRFCKILDGIKPIKWRLEKKCLTCGTGAKPDNPLIVLGICPDCFVSYMDLKRGSILPVSVSKASTSKCRPKTSKKPKGQNKV